MIKFKIGNGMYRIENDGLQWVAYKSRLNKKKSIMVDCEPRYFMTLRGLANYLVANGVSGLDITQLKDAAKSIDKLTDSVAVQITA